MASLGPRSGKSFSWFEERQVFKMAGEYSVKEIAMKLSRHEKSIRNFCARKGISLRVLGSKHHSAKYPEDLYRACIALYDAGFTITKIRQMLIGADEPDESTIQNWCAGSLRSGIAMDSTSCQNKQGR